MDKQLLKYFAQKLPIEKKLELFQRIENSQDLKREFINLQNLISVTELLPSSSDHETGLRSYKLFNSRIKKQTKKTNLIKYIKYAALMLILITSTIISTYILIDMKNDPTLNTLYVPAGQRAQITLQDGTEVWLNALSTLKYPSRFSNRTRYVELIGEAYFDVAENPKKPFIVSTQNMEMKVLGTKFNVSSYEKTNYIKTDLLEGSLMVYYKDSPNKSLILNPNEQIIAKDGEMNIDIIHNSNHFLWKDGIYTFENEKLIDIIDKLQLYYDVTIIVKDPEIFDIRYTGKFRQSDGVDEILKVLQKIQRFNIEKNAVKNTLTLTK